MIESWGGADVDYDWQIPVAEFWLRAHGFAPAAESESVVSRRS